ncbi:DNA repair protein RadC [uncultured Helcococcus sp.]|uniref:RadC family protein n=1 Tax=uncultured Helcococcus sp. TaxID=1072508 RepID=UPI0026037A29|nr:DNA repair protein RadC [uncultured Helcococcus sp.]
MNNYTIKEISKNDRPMEKLYNYGKEVLSDSELLAIILGSGHKNKNAIFLADEILKVYFKDKNLLFASIDQLMEINGIGLSKASRIIASLELGKRLSKYETMNNISLTSPDSVANYLFDHFRDSYREEFLILILDTKNKIKASKTVSIGSINQTLVHPREVFRFAITNNANSIILSHNHPSGDPSPSHEDILITKRLQEAGKLIGIKVLDHIIIGHDRYISLREKKIIEE